MKPLITVMMTVYNGERYLDEAIRSVVDQTYRPLEVIVVDDGSDDASGEIARRHEPAVRVEGHEPRRGMGASRNRAIELATGDLLTFLDADDRMVPDALAIQQAALEDDPALDVVFAHVREFVSPDIDPEERANLRPASGRLPGRLPTTMLCRREPFLRVGGFATHLKMGVGMDWAARAMEANLRWRMLDDVLFERRLHAANNGLRERERRTDYVRAVKAAIDRRRSAASAAGGDDSK